MSDAGHQAFALTEEQTAIYDMARLFRTNISLHMRFDGMKRKYFPVEVFRAAAGLGMAGIYVREDVGGSGLGRLDAALIFEALATGCPCTSAFLSIQQHGRVDDRFLRQRGAAQVLGSAPDKRMKFSGAIA